MIILKVIKSIKDWEFVRLEFVAIYFLIALTIFLLIKINSLESRKNESQSNALIDLQIEKAVARELSRSYAEGYEGRLFPNGQFKDLLSTGNRESSFPKPTIIILFSTQNCHPCLNQELKKYQNVFDQGKRKINIIAIANKPLILDLKIIRKVNQVKFPIWNDENDLISNFVPHEKYPIVMLVDRQRIIKAFYPIPGDIEFSDRNLLIFKRYYSNMY